MIPDILSFDRPFLSGQFNYFCKVWLPVIEMFMIANVIKYYDSFSLGRDSGVKRNKLEYMHT